MGKHYIIDALENHADKKPVCFHMPGHKMGNGLPSSFKELVKNNIALYDMTEVDGLDVLHYPTGVIKKSQEQCATEMNMVAAYYLVNGSSSGIVAAMLATLKPNDLVLVPRNCHSSVINGLLLTDAKPIFYFPEYDEQDDIFLGVKTEVIESYFKKNKLRAIIVLNPNYYGLSSDINSIRKLCDKYNVLLIVDEAHGSLFPFSPKLPVSGVEVKADLVVQSLHKTAGALTQCSLLLVGTDRVNKQKLEQSLRMVQTTSPSYIFMASIEAALCELFEKGLELANESIQVANKIKEKLKQNTKIRVIEFSQYEKEFSIDTTRLILTSTHIGYSGWELAEYLQSKGIYVELADHRYVLLMLSWANTSQDIERLIDVISNIKVRTSTVNKVSIRNYFSKPQYALNPRQAWYSGTEIIPIHEALNCISAETYAPCPPGIPIILPGEIITEPVIETIALEKDEIEVVIRR